jgi:hypothetical protein
VSSWRSGKSDSGAQIDLVIERADHVIHLCEAKYSSSEYVIKKKYSEELRAKRGAFLSENGLQGGAHTTMITTFGLRRNEYAAEVLFHVVLDDLFEAGT